MLNLSGLFRIHELYLQAYFEIQLTFNEIEANNQIVFSDKMIPKHTQIKSPLPLEARLTPTGQMKAKCINNKSKQCGINPFKGY